MDGYTFTEGFTMEHIVTVILYMNRTNIGAYRCRAIPSEDEFVTVEGYEGEFVVKQTNGSTMVWIETHTPE